MARAVAGATLLSVTERGFGKRTALTEYKIQTRGGKGLRNYALSQKTGKVVGIRAVDAADDIMLISSDGIIIRMQLDTIPLIGRSTQGVRLMRLQPDVSIVNFAVTERAAEEPEQADADEGAQAPAAAEEQASRLCERIKNEHCKSNAHFFYVPAGKAAPAVAMARFMRRFAPV